MSFSRLLKKLSSPSLVSPPTSNTGSIDSIDDLNDHPQSSERAHTIPRPWKRKRAFTGHSSISRPSSMPPLTFKAESPLGGTPEMLFDKALPPEPSVSLTKPPLISSPDMIPVCGSPVQDKLAEAWEAVKDDPRIATMSKELHTVGETADAVQDSAQPVTPLVIATFSAVAQSDIGKKIKDGINTFSEGMPVFMNALDELKAVHPFIGVAVLAFKTVYTLEQKRRDNDKKVISLHIGMKDMMGSLLLLNGMEDDKLIAPDGTTIEDRLKPLVERTADDIKACWNLCDAYMKKRPLAKVMLSSLWDARLLDFVELFALRRKEFEFELTRHTSQAVDKSNIKLDLIGSATREIKEQMDYMRTLFEQLVSPEQKQLSDLVEAKGGINVLRNNNQMLLELDKTASKASGSPSVEGRRAPRTKSANTDPKVKDIKLDIFEDPDTAAEKNWVTFSRKFEAQKNQIIDELAFVVRHEGDRVIQELKGKAHERIRDGLIHELWIEMGWRGNVKARHFVLALRDHYLEKHELETKGVPDMGTTAINDSTNPDAWAIKYVDIMWVQPILEAIDDDASGFITVAEVNRFTSSRPTDWSLPHWIAFWAVGFKWALVDYAQKIEDMFAKMEGVRSVVLPPNREAVDRYFGDVWEVVHTLTTAVLSQSSQSIGTEESKKFKPYLETVEARLGNTLKAVDYVIDGLDTLTLITGMGRVEKTLLPLLYLLMKRHYEIMRIMRTKILNMRELAEGAQGISYISDAIIYRVQGLTQNFTQQKLDPEKQFQSFSFGIFKYYHNVYSLWSVDYVCGLDSQITPYDDDDEDQNVQPGDILNHGYKDELCLDYSVYDGRSTDCIPKCDDVDFESPIKDILGTWNGQFYDEDGAYWAVTAMMTFILVPAEGERNFKGDVWSLKGRQTITGSWSKGEDDVMEIRFKMSFSSVLWEPFFFKGRFDPERDALTGVWGLSADLEISGGKMEFRRIPAHYFTVYPSIKELRDDKPRALWRFAIAAVRNDIRRERWSWSYFMQRRDDRKTVISLLVRGRWFGTPHSDEEAETLRVIARRLIPADAFFYDSKVDHIRANTWVHENAQCDSCHGRIGGPRLFCLDCNIKSSELNNTLDLCSAPECVGASVTREDLENPHESNHRLVKVRTSVLTRSHGRVHTAASDAFGRVQETCRKIAESISDSDEEVKPDVQKTSSSSEPTSTEMPVTGPKPDDELNPPADGAKDGAEVEGNTSQDERRGQDRSLPSCGKCNDSLTFPFWYCIFCEDNLFICNTCDTEGVPELMRCSGKHTEEHHLIRCMAPEKDDDDTPATEERLISIENRLDSMQTQFDDLTVRIGDLTSRMGNIEQLLQTLARIGEGGGGGGGGGVVAQS